MEEPLTQSSTVHKCSSTVRSYSTPGNEQLEHRNPVSFRPSQLLSKPAMKRRADINRFAIFLFCSLVPLGSLAPTATSEESKITTGQRQKHFTTRLKPLASVIERQATALFKTYNTCSSLRLEVFAANTLAKDIVKKIPECPAFEADCCVFHIFYNNLQSLRNNIEFDCKNLLQLIDANINQLNVTLSERAALYTCKNEDLPQDFHQVMNMTWKHLYIWLLLQKYEQFMQNTTKLYSSADM